MQIKNMMRNDRSGVSTILVAVIIIVVVVVAAAAVYVVLSDKEDTRTIAPGTVVTYDLTIFGTVYASTLTEEYLGQSASQYFVKMTEMQGLSGTVEYGVEPKGLPEDGRKTGNIEMDTIDGKKNLEIWEYTTIINGMEASVKAYVDPSNGLPYRMEIVDYGTVMVLKEYDLKWQDSYEESDAIGMKYEYTGTSGKVIMECIADCLDGKYGVTFGAESYFLSDYPQGLPTDAVNTGLTDTLINTIDGNVDVQIWKFESTEGTTLFYFDPVSHITYRLAISDLSGATAIVDLTSKPS